MCGDLKNLGIKYAVKDDFLCPHRESNSDQLLRRRPFYPLNYRDRYSLVGVTGFPPMRGINFLSSNADQVGVTGFEPAASASRTLRASQLRQTPIYIVKF